MRHILVLGAGNVLLQDEGLGVRALERLMTEYVLPDNVKAIDGGVMGLDLLPHLDGITDLLLIDAVETGSAPGTLVRIEGDDIPATLALKMSIHQVGLQEVLATGRLMGILPRRVVLWGMQPGALTWGTDLSAPISGRLDALVRAVADELRAWGVSLSDTTSWAPRCHSMATAGESGPWAG